MMARALQLARRGCFSTRPNPSVGCVLVRDGGIVGEGFTQPAGGNHAEIEALEQCSQPSAARGATAYVTLEPCSHRGKTGPCADALIAAGVANVVVAMRDPNPSVSGEGINRLRQAGVNVVEGLLEAEARPVNAGFFQRMETGRARLRIKLASSMDGRTAMADGSSQWNLAKTTVPDATYYADTGLQSGTLYHYRVHAFNGGGSSSNSSTSAETDQTLATQIELNARGYKIKGKQAVELTWSGAQDSTVGIYRDGSPLTTSSTNDGSYIDNIGRKGGGSYQYEVCDMSTASCSNIAGVDF